MIRKPQFKPNLHVEVVEPDLVFLLSEKGHFQLTGRLYHLVASRIDGRRTTDEIVDDLTGQADAAEVYYVIELLEAKGHLAEADGQTDVGTAAFWNALGVDAAVARERLERSPVALASFGGVATAPLVRLLEPLGIRLSEAGAFTVALTDDYLQEALAECNRRMLQEKRPWMLVKPVGAVLWIGPIFVPGRTGCWECLADRMRSNRAVEAFLHHRKGTSAVFPVSRAAVAPSVQTALGLAAVEAARWVVQEKSEHLEGKLLTLDLATLTLQTHTLVRRPQCISCGWPLLPNREPAPVVLKPCPKGFTADGGHRVVSPEETVKRLEYHVSPITGAVRTLTRLGGSDGDVLHVYYAGHNFGSHDSLQGMRQGFRANSAGKGATDAQARASGLCEAIERYSGLYRGDAIRRQAAFRELGDGAIHPNRCMLFSDRQYQERGRWNATGSKFNQVFDPFDEAETVEWTPAWSLTRGDFRLLPTAFCYFGYRLPEGRCFSRADSNGNAAGNTLEEAVLQGFLELAERDAVAVWWYNRLRRPAVDLDSFDDAFFHRFKAAYARRGREILVSDLTNDLGIPAVAAVSRRKGRPLEEIVLGFGAHLDPRLALSRALTEMNQMLPDLQRKPEDGEIDYTSYHGEVADWLKTATLANQPYLVPDERLAPRTASDYPRLWGDDLLTDVQTCQAAVERQGLEMLVLDQTRPDLGLPVVKVVVPGLRHFWARFAPGRLYDVPVALGWRPSPATEDDLNPIPIFF